MSITYDIYKAFDANPSFKVRGVFLDLSKAFDNVWHDGLLHKLRRMGLCGKYFGLIDTFLSGRFQRVLLNGQKSKWSQIKAGVPKGSILGPLLLLVYINDLPEGLKSNVKLFTDDTRFSRWFVTEVLRHYLLIRTYPKYRNGGKNRRCYLILMLQNKPETLPSHAKKILPTIVTSASITCH